MHGKQHHKVLSNAFSRDFLLEQGKNNGVNWDEDKHEGVNWMRFSNSLVDHLNQGNQFDTDDVDADTLHQMKDQYHQLRDMHKQTMIPHIRAAMAKLHQDSGDPTKSPSDHLQSAYDHLDANGGHVWAEKVRTLSHLNQKVKEISDKLVSKM